jgi:hypothetical protein
MSRAWSAVLGLLIAAPFYWLLIDTTSSPELWAGGAAALIAAGAFSAAGLESTETVRIRPRWLPFVLAQLAAVPRGMLIVCREIIAQAIDPSGRRGTLEAEPLTTGEGEAADLGRLALVEAARSFAPNTIVIGADSDHDRLVLHRLGPKP